ncbi:hypothetical protein ACFO0N_07020 [Halobium salinum]|uniref:Uncharacterized protein n=1 Tax=Halobium salinum TaxID=1364940 RepID=A0ABD5P9X8_9EURY
MRPIDRRTALCAGGVVVSTSLAGCSWLGGDHESREGDVDPDRGFDDFPNNARLVPQALERYIVAAGPDLSTGVRYFEIGSDFGQALNDAWAYLENGGWIFLPAGRYGGRTSIVPQNSGVQIRGAGWGSNNQDGSVMSAIGTEYAYRGGSHAFDISGLERGVMGCSLKYLKLTDAGGNGTHGMMLSNTSPGNGKIQGWHFEEVFVSGFGGDCWHINTAAFNSILDGIYGYGAGNNGFTTNGSASVLYVVGQFVNNRGWGAEMGAGASLDVSLRCDSNGDGNSGGGAYVGAANGHFNLWCERNRGSGVIGDSTVSGTMTVDLIENNQAGEGAFELTIADANDLNVFGTIELRDHRNAIYLRNKATVHFGGISVFGNPDAFYDVAGRDVSFAGHPPNGLSYNQVTEAECNDEGRVGFELDGVYSHTPVVDVAVVSTENVPSNASLGYPQVETGRDQEGDVNRVSVQFVWSDGSTPETGDVVATISCTPR